MSAAMLAASLWLASSDASAQFQIDKQIFQDPPEEPKLVWNAAVGAVLNTGNTENVTLNGGTHFVTVQGRHGVAADGKVVWGKSRTDAQYQNSAFNINLFGRYDFYLTRMNALFMAAAYRHDEFAGLSHRSQGKAGYLRNLVKTKTQRFWFEVGYDLTYDILYRSTETDDIVHSARGFVGYTSGITDALDFRTGVETLVNVENARDVRVTWDNALTSQLVDQVSLELKVLLQFDNVPVVAEAGQPPREKLDTLTQLSLVYAFI